MSDLRTQLIRLAHADPELRPHLLPLLREAARGTHVPVRDLPPILQRALREVGYNRRDISVEAHTTFSGAGAGGEGIREFTVIVNMETGSIKTEYGSWGGANPWSKPNLVDSDTRQHPLPVNGAVIRGNEGGGRPVWAMIMVNPENMAQLLPEKVDLTGDELKALKAVRLKPGYRADEFSRHGLGAYGPDNALVKALAKKGLVKVTGSGVTITTDGKNALDGGS